MPSVRLAPARNEPLQQETLDRWGVHKCHLVDRAAMDAGLSRLIEIDGPLEEHPWRTLMRLHREEGEAVRRHLDDAIAMAWTGERTHSSDDLWPHGIADELDELLQDLEAHDVREAFVRSQIGAAPATPTPLPEILREDHAIIQAQLDSLRALTRDYAAPAHACTVWRLLYVLCAKVECVLARRIHLEESSPAEPAPQSYGDTSLSPSKVGPVAPA